jgi:hypothetical protein
MHTEIEIARSPEQVREAVSIDTHIPTLSINTPQQFLDFPSYSTWTQGFIRSITHAKPSATLLQKGDKLKCVLKGMTITPTVLENSSSEFRWRGMLWGIPGLFTGEHCFRFEPSKITPGGTTFVQSEKFSGVLSFLIAEGTAFAKQTREGFEGFNGDLKKKCESME